MALADDITALGAVVVASQTDFDALWSGVQQKITDAAAAAVTASNQAAADALNNLKTSVQSLKDDIDNDGAVASLPASTTNNSAVSKTLKK